MRILGIGETVLDVSHILPAFPREDSKNQPETTTYSVGGPVAAALTLLRNLGATCVLATSIGTDEAGRMISDQLEEKGIKLHTPSKTTDHSKVHTYLVNRQNGSRTGIKSTTNTPAVTTVPQSLIEWADLILFDRHVPEAFDQVKRVRPAVPTIIDPSTDTRPQLLDRVKKTTVPIMPIEAVHGWDTTQPPAANLQSMARQLEKPLLITCGSHGSLLYDEGEVTIGPSLQIDAVDTLGAGDVFRGAVAYGLLNHWPLKRILGYANRVAGLQCTKPGNGTAIPTAAEITAAQALPFRETPSLTTMLARSTPADQRADNHKHVDTASTSPTTIERNL